jgi:hypothetical protein|eukprot:COSAG02_NODE_8261_length_2638_cov_55.172817_2_plen_51_part_00
MQLLSDSSATTQDLSRKHLDCLLRLMHHHDLTPHTYPTHSLAGSTYRLSL